jgi:NitT/TauT family transport system permease protein
VDAGLVPPGADEEDPEQALALRVLTWAGFPLLGFVILIAVWECVVLAKLLPADVLPTPWSVAADLGRQWSLLQSNALVTLKEIFIGFAASIVIGIPVGAAIAFSRTLSRIIYPIIIVSQAVPKIVVAPLFVLWFGFGSTSNILVAVLVAIFPVIVNTTLGLSEIDPDYIRLAKVMGGNAYRTFWKVRLPDALPSIFSGLKLAITFATLGAVAGELIAGQVGLGYLINFGSGNLDAQLTFAAIVVLSVIGVILFYLVVLAERLSIRGRRPS